MQSQKHGFVFENCIKETVFGIPYEKNNTDKYDVPCEKNCLNNNENISIKTTGGKGIDCSDIIRFYNYDFDKDNKIIVIKYFQCGDDKTIKNIYEINYNKECHNLLFGNVPINELIDYVNFVKSIPPGEVSSDIKKDYKEKKKLLQSTYSMKIKISPKVDSKSQRRVQCSIPKFEELLSDFIEYKSENNKPNVIRNKEIILSINSPKRKRNSKEIKINLQ